MKISSLYVNDFRSLVDFNVNEFDSTTIFYGENNAGKSNILKILELIFKRKVQYSDGDFTEPKNFYEGLIKDFSNNFFNNDKALAIEFKVNIELSKDETVIKEIIKKLFKTWPDTLVYSIEGYLINSTLGEDLAEIHIKSMKVNDKPIYESGEQSINYFPTVQSNEAKNIGELSLAFSNFIDPLNDCVYLIGSNRETHPTQFNNELVSSFKPSDFKKSLYSLYLNENTYKDFEDINTIFNQDPFSFGTLSFSNHNNELDIMIKKDGIRLPLKHLGSGAEQILFTIASIVCAKSKILGIEELEQNLSPKLQNLALIKIQSMIGKNLDQLILSSHSSVFAKTDRSKAIYLIERKNLKTFVADRLHRKYSKKIKKHFIDTALPYDTYTEKELKDNFEEIKKIAEERFRM